MKCRVVLAGFAALLVLSIVSFFRGRSSAAPLTRTVEIEDPADTQSYGFYHIWISGAHPMAGFDVVRDQVAQLQERVVTSSLVDKIPKLQITIVSPTTRLGNDISSFIKTELVNKNVFEIQGVHHENQGQEDVTLTRLYDHCLARPNSFVFYMHSKGSYHSSSANTLFRRVCTEWVAGAKSVYCEETIRANIADTCAPRFSWIPHPHYPGNFWWARCDYVRTLMRPQFMFMFYTLQKEGLKSYEIGRNRYFMEHWVTAHPHVRISECMGESGWTAGPPTVGNITDIIDCRMRHFNDQEEKWHQNLIDFRNVELDRWYGANAQPGAHYLEGANEAWEAWDLHKAKTHWGPMQGA